MERDRYPSNWDDIALEVKESANWTCSDCGRTCRKPGEALQEFIDRIVGGNWRDNGELTWEIAEHPQRWTLTVGHLDQNPANNDPSNLKALCSGCHLKFDAPFRHANAHAKRERKGQLTLEGL
jgi:5-methylcytosine-specific restriction endonuclease McrA